MITESDILSTIDAMIWAEAFCQRFEAIKMTDDGLVKDMKSLMVGWFSNAIMVGYDKGVKAGMAARG